MRRMNILVADGDINHLSKLERILINQGYSCQTASKGDEALKKIDSGSIDMIFADIQLPDTDGVQVVHTVREKYGPNIPIVLLSEREEMRRGTDFLLGRENLFLLRKPVKPEDAISIVEAYASVKAYSRRVYSDILILSEDKGKTLLHSKIDSLGKYEIYTSPIEKCMVLKHVRTERVGVVINTEPLNESSIDILNNLHDVYPYIYIIQDMSRSKSSYSLDSKGVISTFMNEWMSQADISRILRNGFEKKHSRIKKLINTGEPHVWGIAGPKAVSKTTLAKGVRRALPCAYDLIKYKTRPLRSGERNWDDQVIVSDDYFKRYPDDFITFSNYGHTVGIRKGVIDEKLLGGRDVIVTIPNMELFYLMKKSYHDMKTILLLSPPQNLVENNIKRGCNGYTLEDATASYQMFVSHINEFDNIISSFYLEGVHDECGVMEEDIASKIKQISAIIKLERYKSMLP